MPVLPLGLAKEEGLHLRKGQSYSQRGTQAAEGRFHQGSLLPQMVG